MAELGRAASRIDTSKPHPARMYDYYLGGKDHYEVDQQAAEKVVEINPGIKVCAGTNRRFMHRATRYLAAAGVRQFLDIGTGIPTEPNLHQVAQSVAPEARVVYADNDPIVLTHAQALLRSTREGRTAYIHADVREPEKILAAQELRETLDMSQPVALSLNALLHFVPDEFHAYDLVERLVAALAPGSYLVLSHVTSDFAPDVWARVVDIYHRGGIPAQTRSRAEVERFFTGLELVEPGVEVPHRWRPDAETDANVTDADVSLYGAVARKP
ncbi:SAM-dependent methyltransferase [Streptomyces sp. AC536]|uniref:SAM-dependent methyltransferase n=1 Tax=Streptomyces buecherae TaxID=2763006 RepID=UPI00164E0110|nr:SAM-dependent methyltransferase [Streptomyces buecherae]MBC3981315.1 SAM-dependent methyltransferase [Streptomyces buecherae]QNJ43932.1 SAM-dependent methyltransferase [Streptomyces buecherae]